LEGHTSWVNAVEITPDGRRAVSISEDYTVRTWDLESGKGLLTMHCGSMVYALAVTPDGRRAISGSADVILRVWDLETGKELHRLDGHPDGIYGISRSR
jgi:WD40 repeat protein